MNAGAGLAPREIIRLEPDAVVILDQRALPARRIERRLTDVPAVVDAIRTLAVRGAPAIGIAGAMGVALAALRADDDRLTAAVAAAVRDLRDARPTAVNLAWAVDQMAAVAAGTAGGPAAVRDRLAAAARRLHDDEVERCRLIGAAGASLIADGATIVTQCNAGALATGGYGTALGVIRSLAARGGRPRVIVPETRPLLQGSRLTAYELAAAGIAHVVVTDNAVAQVFQRERVDCVVVGADRIARNGDTANKIGTYALALIAAAHGVPLFVAAPTTTIDATIADGAAIPIEERARDEVAAIAGVALAPAASPCANPAFDVTPAHLIAAIATEDGVMRPPYAFDITPRLADPG